MAKNTVKEIDLILGDLLGSDKMVLTNSVRKEIFVKEVWFEDKLFKSFET